jgi:protein SCO1/2
MVHVASTARRRRLLQSPALFPKAKYHGQMSRSFTGSVAAVTLAACTMLVGCKKSTEILPSHTHLFTIKGKVVATDPERGELTLQHEAIPGFMEAMTMPYKLQRREMVKEFHPGDIIRARLAVDQYPEGDYHNPRLDELAILAQSKPDFKPSSNYHVPTAGDVLPDFNLVDQDGKPVRTAQFKGKALLITFIYTRCPLDDFCPKMSRNFAAITKSLSTDKALYDSTHMLSISFDPAFDTPSVLKAYGKSYTGSDNFAHWQFVAPAKDALPAVTQYFNVGVTPENDKSLTHSLSTVLIDPAGKIAAWYPGSEWTPEEVVSKIRSMPRS